MKTAPSLGEATKTIVFLNMNWNVVDASDIYKLCEDVVNSENIKEVKICKTKIGESLGDTGACKDIKEFKTKTLAIVKQSYVALVVLNSVETAIQIYNELDSMELENSGMFFDIRFVDDEIKTGEVVQSVTSGENFVFKDYNKFKLEETTEENKRGKLLEKLFSSKNTNTKLLNELISISDDEEEDEELEDKKKKLFEEKEVIEEEAPSKDNIKEQNENIKEAIKDKQSPSFIFDPLDPRFSQIYSDSDFTIDPSHPEYQRNNKLKEIIKEKRRRLEEN